MLAWFADHPLATDARSSARRRFDAAVATLVPESFARHDLGGDDWGVTVLHPADQGAWRWPTLARDGDVSAVSLGVPVGVSASGPVALARELLGGADVHAGVVPPFGMLALAGDREFAVQQDWLGMCRLFTAGRDGVTALCTRPGLLADFLGLPRTPDRAGWASYVLCGHFGGLSSPIGGVRLLRPGERVAGRRSGGGWRLTSAIRHSADDVVAAGLAARGKGVAAALDAAADGFAGTIASVCGLYGDALTLGLSGGKDSRLVAAAFVAAGRLPRFITNDDNAAEADVARRLVAILRERRDLRPEHQVAPAQPPAVALVVGLRERVARIQRLYDYQYPSTYTVRWPGPARLPAAARPASVTGAAGELAVGYWYPAGRVVDDVDRAVTLRIAVTKQLAALRHAVVPDGLLRAESDRVDGVLDRGEALGLRGLELVDYLYLMERTRRWSSSAYAVGMVTPFLAPAVVAASFALSPAQKRGRLLHDGLLERFLPEWADVPYAGAARGRSTQARIWDGDGLPVLHELYETTGGSLVGLLRRDEVAAALARCVRGAGTGPDERTLQQFACLAAASQELEPEGVRRASRSFAEFVAEARAAGDGAGNPVPAPVAWTAARLRFVKRSSLGRRAWMRLRGRIVRARRRRPGP